MSVCVSVCMCLWNVTNRPRFHQYNAEGTAEQLDVEKLGGVWYAKTTSFINQAGWLGSREQVLEWNSTCKERFLDGWGCVHPCK